MWDAFLAQFGVANLVPIAQTQEGVITELPPGVVGKVPSIYVTDNEIKGFKNWQNGRATHSQFSYWKKDGRYGFGVITGKPLPDEIGAGVAVCIDVDLEDEEQQKTINRIICATFNVDRMPQRVRENSPRRAYVLRVITEEPIFKRVLKLEPNKDTGKQEAVEILGLGQQFAAWGVHPSGACIEWLDDSAESMVAEPTPPDLRRFALTLDQFNELIDAIAHALPIIADTTKAARRQRVESAGDYAADDVALYLDEKGYTLDIGSEGERYIRSPFAHEYSTEQGDSDTSVCYFLPGTHGYEVGHFVSMHASDAERGDHDWLDAIGFIADQFETLPALIEDSPRSVPYMGISGKGCLLNDKGYCGNSRADKIRAEISLALRLPLQHIPPMVTPRYNNKGELTGFTALNHSMNLRFAIERMRLMLMINLMNYQIELLTPTGEPATRSDAQTSSMIVNSLAECAIPLDTESKHFDALAGINTYHPIYRLFHDREWDGVKRVDDVLACVNAKDPAFATRVIRKTLIAAIAALEEGAIAMKSVPVLYSRENNYFKSAFIKRLFDIVPGAFVEGLSVDPRSKDSLRPAVMAWGVELGELDSMSKVESGLLKAWIPNDKDKWRTEHKSFFTEKPRQTVYMGTVNKDDFIKDDTLASRFPVIALAGPVHIDRLNKLLGWEHTGKTAKLVNPELLVQFWLEVREYFRSGEGYNLDRELLTQAYTASDDFTDKGSFYEILAARIDKASGSKEHWPFMRLPDICAEIGVSPERSALVGKALKKLVAENITDTKRPKNVVFYRFPDNNSLIVSEFV